MYLAQVTGAIVSTTKHESLNGNKLLVVTRLDQQHRPTSETEIAIDCVGAGNSDIVVVTTGSSARKAVPTPTLLRMLQSSALLTR